MRECLSIERVAVNKILDEPIGVRQEGTVTIIPVIEEVVVSSKKLVLKEEIRITRRQEVFRHSETVPIRSEEVTIERIGPTK
jgi:stress response protein YsnF